MRRFQRRFYLRCKSSIPGLTSFAICQGWITNMNKTRWQSTLESRNKKIKIEVEGRAAEYKKLQRRDKLYARINAIKIHSKRTWKDPNVEFKRNNFRALKIYFSEIVYSCSLKMQLKSVNSEVAIESWNQKKMYSLKM